MSVEIRMGGMSPKISQQLRGKGLPMQMLRHFDKDADAITRLYVRGFLTNRECSASRERLAKKITQLIEAAS